MIDLVGIAIGGCSFALIMLAVLRWEALAVCFVLTAILDQHFGLDVGYKSAFFTVQPADIVSVVAILAAAIRLVMCRRFTAPQLLWMVLALVFALAFLRGVSSFGVMTAGNYFRRTFYFTAATLYFLGFEFSARDLRRLIGFWLAAGVVLGCYAVLGWIFPEIRPPELIDNEITRWATAMDDMRTLSAPGVLILAQCVALTMSGWATRDFAPFRKAASISMLLLVVVLLHRSVWVSLLSATAVLIVLDYRKYARLIQPMIYGLVLFGFVFTFFLMGDARETVTEGLNIAVTEPFEADDNSTFAWRVTGWKILLKQAVSEGPGTILFGDGFGTSFDRWMGGGTVVVSPHNAYIEIFLDAGLLGLGLYVAYFAQVALNLWRRRTEPADGLADPRMALALLSTVVIFSVPYFPYYDQGLLLGGIGAYSAARSRLPAVVKGRAAMVTDLG